MNTKKKNWRLPITVIAGTIAFATLLGVSVALPVTDGMDASWVIGQPDFTSSSATTSQSGLNIPEGALFDPNTERLYVADGSNNRVVVHDLSSGITDGQNAMNVLGQPDYTTSTANTACGGGSSGSTNACGLSRPTTLALNGNLLYVADANNNRIAVFDIASISNGEAAVGAIGQPDLTTGTDDTACGGGSSGSVNACGLDNPFSVTAAGSKVYVADNANNRVLRFPGYSGTDGVAAERVLGQPDYVTEDANTACGGGSSGSVNACGMFLPTDIAYDSALSDVYVSDGANNRVLAYDNIGSSGGSNGQAASGVFGQPDMTTGTANTACGGGSSGSTNACGFDLFFGSGISFDTVDGRLFIADSNNNRVMVHQRNSIATGPAAVNVLGQTSMTGSGSGTSQSAMFIPLGVSYDEARERLYALDAANSRVLVYGVPAGSQPVVTEGASSYSATENPDGSTTIDLEEEGSGYDFTVTLPDGSTPATGNDAINITVDDGPGGNKPSININAELNGGTKTIVFPWTNRDICIIDQPNASIGTQGSCSGVKVKKNDFNQVGECTVWEESDEVCRTSSTELTIEGLEHSALFALADADDDGVPDDDDMCPETDVNGPIPTQSLRNNHTGDDTVLNDGCNCSQILDAKPGANNGEKKFGCTQGTINVWENGGW